MANKYTNTRTLRRLKASLLLSVLQKEIILGTILGDGCLITSYSGKSARLQIRHKKGHKEYVEWKHKFFAGWVLTQPRIDPFNNSWYFRTISHPDLMEIKRLFYKGKRRFVPKSIARILKSPLSLAVWAMDDGNGYAYKNYPGFRISTYGFGLDGNRLLQQCLQENFGLEVRIYQDAKGAQLFFPKKSALRLYQIIEPYLVNCMRYKFAALTP